MSNRGSWRVNEDGELVEQPKADYPAEAEKQQQRMIRERDQAERDERAGTYL